MDVKLLRDPQLMKLGALFLGETALAGVALGAGFKAGLYTAVRVDQHFKKHSDSNNSIPATLSVSPSPAGLHLNIDIPPQSLQGLRADTFTRSQR